MFVGNVLQSGFTQRRFDGGCGVGRYGPFNLLALNLRVREVWVGTAEDTLVEVFVLFSSAPPPGSTLLVWAARICDDGWRLSGNFATIDTHGRVITRGGDYAPAWIAGRPNDTPPLAEELHSIIDLKKFLPSAACLRGAAALGLARVTDVLERPEGGYSYACDSMKILLGAAPGFPRHVDIPLATDCFPEIFRGQLMLVPITKGFAGSRMTLSTCPRALAVQDGFLPAFGVPVDSVARAIRLSEKGLEARPFLDRSDQ